MLSQLGLMIRLIESYSFGRIIIDGQVYTSDIIIYPDKIDSSWWRLKGHLLQIDDLRDILNYKPEVLVVGTGAHGLMEVSDELKQLLKEKRIEIIIKFTEEACNNYNELKKKKKVIGAFHLTC